jgi:hypothetical protein
MDGTRQSVPNNDNPWVYKAYVEEMQKSSRELKNIHLDAKLLSKNSDELKVPDI